MYYTEVQSSRESCSEICFFSEYFFQVIINRALTTSKAALLLQAPIFCSLAEVISKLPKSCVWKKQSAGCYLAAAKCKRQQKNKNTLREWLQNL